jgi:hypothetical protein
MPPVKSVGKPCAGKPHARFDGRGLETDHDLWRRASPRPSDFVMLVAAGRLTAGIGQCGRGLAVVAKIYGHDR